MKIVKVLLFIAIAGAAAASGQQSGESHNFLLDKWNTPIFVGEVGIHLWSGRQHNDVLNDQLSICPVDANCVPVDPPQARFYGQNNHYSYAKEFAIMGASVSFAALLHRSGHHKWERVALFADVGAAALSGWLEHRRYGQIDCQFHHFECH